VRNAEIRAVCDAWFAVERELEFADRDDVSAHRPETHDCERETCHARVLRFARAHLELEPLCVGNRGERQRLAIRPRIPAAGTV
jgi:hypothetical protein